MIIREIDGLCVAGQIQPKMEVFAPNSRAQSKFMKKRLTVYIYQRLRVQTYIHTISISISMSISMSMSMFHVQLHVQLHLHSQRHPVSIPIVTFTLQESGKLQISEMFSSFPDQSETAIRAKMKEVAEFQRAGPQSGWWTPKPNSRFPRSSELHEMGEMQDEMGLWMGDDDGDGDGMVWRWGCHW